MTFTTEFIFIVGVVVFSLFVYAANAELKDKGNGEQ